MNDAFEELGKSVQTALETYSNVHRGSGHYSLATTHLFDHARGIVLDHLGLKKRGNTVIFCTQVRAAHLASKLRQGSYTMLSSRDIGLPIGITALAVNRKELPAGIPFQSGGGTARLIASNWVIWDGVPGRFEAGTPSIIHVIAFARALQLIRQRGNDIFKHPAEVKSSAADILLNDGLTASSGQDLYEELSQTCIGRNVTVPTLAGPVRFVNLDNAASTPAFEPAWNAAFRTWSQPPDIQKEIIRETRSICADFLGAPKDAYDVIFTSNTTEAINLVACSLDSDHSPGGENAVLITILEHSSNDLPWRTVPGHSLVRVPAGRDGTIDLTRLDAVLKEYNEEGRHANKRIRLVAVSGASNVLGACNDLQAISSIAHRYGACLLVDGAQLVAHRQVRMEQWGIDYLAFSAHKIYAPFGTGVLVVRKGLPGFNPGEMETIRMSGDDNAAGIAGMGKSLLLLQRIGMDVIGAKEHALTRKLLQRMAQVPGIRIYGIRDPESPAFGQKTGVVAFTLKGGMPDRLARELALRGGIGIRYGCHCAHLLVKDMLKVSPPVERFQRLLITLFPKISLPGVARVSLGIENSEEDIDRLIRILEEIAGKPASGKQKRTDAGDAESAHPDRRTVKRQVRDFTSLAVSRVYNQQ